MSELLDINDRIKYIMEHEGHTVATFARKCGVPDGTLRNLLARGTKPGYDLMVTIIKAVNQPWCDANWLVMGQKTEPVVQNEDTKKLLKIIEDQQKTIADLQKQNAKLTDRLLSATDK